MIRVADLVFYFLIRLIGWTTRFNVRGSEHLEAVEQAGKLPIICFWHEQIFLGTYFFRNRKIVVMTSQSFDGEYIARFIQRFGYGAARGSSTRGGVGAMVEMIRLMKLGCPASVSVDGPKGPRRIAKEGAILLAKKTGQPIIAFAVAPRRLWTLKSWDKMQIPTFFTNALAEIAEPIWVAADADEVEIHRKRDELQAVLDSLSTRADLWRNRS